MEASSHQCVLLNHWLLVTDSTSGLSPLLGRRWKKVHQGVDKVPPLNSWLIVNQFPSLGAFQKLSYYHKPMVDKTAAAVAAKSLQSCLTLCDPIDGSPTDLFVPGILQARTLEWVAISFSSAWKWKVKVQSLSHIGLSATPWTSAYQAPPSMGFSRQE